MTQTALLTADKDSLANQLFTCEEFYNYDDDSDACYELVDGELIEMPTESPANCNVAAILIMTFDLPKPSNFERRHRLFKDRYCGYSQ